MRIGIIGPGNIAGRFAKACGFVKDVTLYAVASSQKERAAAFAEQYRIPHVPGSYRELWEMEEVDAVYIANVNTRHYQAAKSCLLAGKAVLCEKPLCVDLEQTRDLIETARERGALLMEAMWTATLPCIRQAREWVEEGRIGAVNYLDSSFSFFCPRGENHRLYSRELGGGGMLDVGIYCLAFSLLMLGREPLSVKASLQLGDTGIDEMGAALLTFPKGVIANCMFGVQGQAAPDAHIYGSRGQIYLKEFFGCRRVELRDPFGRVLEVFEDPQEEGFVHEIRAFYEAWREGRLEAAGASHWLSLECAGIMEEIRRDAENLCREGAGGGGAESGSSKGAGHREGAGRGV